MYFIDPQNKRMLALLIKQGIGGVVDNGEIADDRWQNGKRQNRSKLNRFCWSRVCRFYCESPEVLNFRFVAEFAYLRLTPLDHQVAVHRSPLGVILRWRRRRRRRSRSRGSGFSTTVSASPAQQLSPPSFLPHKHHRFLLCCDPSPVFHLLSWESSRDWPAHFKGWPNHADTCFCDNALDFHISWAFVRSEQYRGVVSCEVVDVRPPSLPPFT